jgi:tetratricopeptide (TPR) repeat protein
MTVWQRLHSQKLLAALLILTAGLYVQVWQHSLIWDEHTLTTQQVLIHPSWVNYHRSFQETYRPLALITIAGDHLLWSGWPPGYAVDSLAYHLLVVVLVFAFARQWLTPFPAMTAALIAALHPVGAETVSYLLGRPDLLSAACLVAALLVFMKLERPDRRTLKLVLFWCLGLLALAAKETALLLPFLTVCVASPTSNEAGDRREVLRRRMLAVGPFVVLFVLYATARVIGKGWGGEGWTPTGVPMKIHLAIDTLALMASTSAIALKALIWPVDLCPWYEGQNAIPASTGVAAGLLLFGLTGAVAAAWRLRRHAPAVSLGLTWITGIVGLIAIRAAADPPPMNPLAVRWLYPAMLGLALMAGGILQCVETRWPRLSRVLIFCLLSLYAGMNWQAQSLWQDDLRVLGRAFHCAPHSPLVTIQYANLLHADGQLRAADHLMMQLKYDHPFHPLVLSRQMQDAISQGNYEQALIYAKQIATIAPSPLAFRRLANLEVATGRADAAVKDYVTALASTPDDMLVIVALGTLYEQRRQWDNALGLYAQGLTLHPEAANLWFRYGRVCEATGKLPEALHAYEEVMRRDRFCSNGVLAVARIHERMGDAASASSILRRYTESTHQSLVPRPTTDPFDSPCGMEAKSGAMISGGQTPTAHP